TMRSCTSWGRLSTKGKRLSPLPILPKLIFPRLLPSLKIATLSAMIPFSIISPARPCWSYSSSVLALTTLPLDSSPEHSALALLPVASFLIYDPECYAFAFQADSHRKSCRPCPHNHYFALHTAAPLRVLLPCSRFRRLIFPAGLDHFPREIRHDGFDTESEKMF